jgi:hypothetical protein
MKLSTVLLLILISSATAFAQLGTYGWFKRDQVPYYATDANNFNAFVSVGGAEKNGFLPGYYLTKNGEKIEGQVQYNFPFLMERILVFKKEGVTSILNPKDVNGYFVDGITFESVTVNASLLGTTKLETYFMIPEVKGKLSLYYYSGENPMELDSDADFSKWGNYYSAYTKYSQRSESEIQKFTAKTRYLKKEYEVAMAVEPMAFGFANKMGKVVSDCTAVANGVKNKEKGYRVNDLEKIIQLYNNCDRQ